MIPDQTPVKILIAEDVPTDAEMVQREIRKVLPESVFIVVDTEADFTEMINSFHPDLVLSDYRMPSFDGMSALKITKQHDPEVPFIIVTGSINEETAVSCLKAGAVDYVLKESLKRLGQAVLNALEQKKNRSKKADAENALVKSEEKFRNLFINHSAVKLIIDPQDGRIIDANQSASDFYGYSHRQLTSMRIGDINILSPEELETEMNRAMSKKSIFFEFKHRLASGKIRDVEVFSSKIMFGEKEYLHSIIHDITEKKQAENQLRLLSRSVEQSPVSIVITDRDGNIEYVNNTFTRIMGYTPEEVRGKNPRIWKSGQFGGDLYKNLWNTILSGKEWKGELLNVKKDGTRFWEDVSISPVFDNKGKITHFVAVKEDITEKKRMLEELVAAKEKAEESDRLKSAFLANMSHEIRTPMNGILGFASLLKEQNFSGDEKQHFIEIIESSGQRMLATINDLIDISKIESGMVKAEYSPFLIHEEMLHIYEFFIPEAFQKGLKLVYNHAGQQTGVEMVSDKIKLSAILINLIKNALKFTHQGTVEFGYKVLNEHVTFFVKDTGIGIQKKDLNNIFERFFQADDTLNRGFEGSGLGLSISKAYVEMMGGRIWAESEKGEGAMFCFVLPLRLDNGPDTLPVDVNRRESLKDIFSDLNILIAEDDEVGHFYLSTLFEKHCKKMYFADNGKDAVEIYLNNPEINVILMDMRMPVMDGYTATSLIRKSGSKVLIIAQTAYAMAGDREKAIAAGCDEYLTKPLDKNKLFEVIRFSLSRKPYIV